VIYPTHHARFFSTIALLVATACASAGHGAFNFHYPNFSTTTDLNMVSSATQSGSDIRLNPSTANRAGAVWFNTKQAVRYGFDTTFTFRVTSPAGITDPNGHPGGDGLAFVVQNTSSTAMGATNSYMGYEINNSIAAEFDTHLNSNFSALEPGSNHVGVQSAGLATNNPFSGAYKGAAAIAINLSDGNTHTGRVLYHPGSLSIYVDNLTTPALTVAINLATLLSLDNEKAFVGFTGGGAASFENHFLSSWSFESLPEPGCFLTVGLSLLLVGMRRRSFDLLDTRQTLA